MPEFFLELFSEEIPAGEQARAGINLKEIVADVLQPVRYNQTCFLTGPRRIAILGSLDATSKSADIEEIKGPRADAPDAAIDGFARKHKILRSELVIIDGVYFLRRVTRQISATELIESNLPSALTRFPWRKSMRWGQSGNFSWIRPLRRMVCLVDGEIVPIKLGPITAARETQGHSGFIDELLSVQNAADWKVQLKEHGVIADQADREDAIKKQLQAKVSAAGLKVVPDNDLLNEVTGLVEWPVVLLGKIDERFMDLPAEVRQLSMKVNQKYFALNDMNDRPASFFAFVANMEALDGGAAIITGNERVLRARLSDAKHFWNRDLETPLNDLLPKLKKITFHEKIGMQSERAERISRLAVEIANWLDAQDYAVMQARWAGLLCKTDLATGMVGELPELQGIIGGYYAQENPRGWDGEIVGAAIRTHYLPKGPGDDVPRGLVPCAVALADKLDTLTKFFQIGEKPTGSGDPYALRRAALGVIRIILENGLTLPLKPLLEGDVTLFDFIIARLRVKLRGEGKRFDIVDAVLAAGGDDDLLRLMKRAEALGDMLATEDGKNLLAAYKRAVNILKIEEGKSGVIHGVPIQSFFEETEERNLATMLNNLVAPLTQDLLNANYTAMMSKMANLRVPVDAFFEKVTVNAEPPELRQNRLKILSQLRDTMHAVADFSKLEG